MIRIVFRGVPHFYDENGTGMGKSLSVAQLSCTYPNVIEKAKKVITRALYDMEDSDVVDASSATISYDEKRDLFVVELAITNDMDSDEVIEEELRTEVEEMLALGPDSWMESDINLLPENLRESADLFLELVDVCI